MYSTAKLSLKNLKVNQNTNFTNKTLVSLKHKSVQT